VISGNAMGISVAGATSAVIVKGNYIGTDWTGTVDLGNGTGVALSPGTAGNIIGGLGIGERNLISGNALYNVHLLSSSNNAIIGNTIGPDVNDSGVAMTSGTGLRIEGTSSGNTIGPDNVISDNGGGTGFGVLLTGVGPTTW
jgi:hypothetical protein